MGEIVQDSETISPREELLQRFKPDSALVKAMQSVPPELCLKTEDELEKLFRVTALDCALKKRVWEKFHEIKDDPDAIIRMKDIYDGLCTATYFFRDFMANSFNRAETFARIVWLVTPPIDDWALVEMAFKHSFEKMLNGVLKMPVTEKSAPALIKLFTYFADRKLGPMVQRIDTRNLNVDVEVPAKGLDPEEMARKLEELKSKLLPSKDVTPSESE